MLRLRSPAKINLTLEILARRDDGYHGIRSLMVPIGLYDEINAEPAASDSFACNGAALAGANSVTQALAAARCAPVRLTLVKHIPIGGGLGGGSSDAATILLAAMDGRLSRTNGETTDWLAIARELGSDVPFFLVGTGALVEGTGERVTAAGALPTWWVVVAAPHAHVPTAEAYRVLDAARTSDERAVRPRNVSRSLEALDALQRADFGGLVEALVNDFNGVVPAAYRPVRDARDALAEAAGTRAMLSGSGACSFALFEREDEARAAAARLDSKVAQGFVAPFVSDGRWR